MNDNAAPVSREVLADQCRILGEALLNFNQVDSDYKAKFKQWEEDNAALVSTRAALRDLTKQLDGDIRAMAVALFKDEDGAERNLTLGVSVELKTVAIYDADELRRAALTQMPALLTLNVGAVEQLALAIFQYADLRKALMVSLPLEAVKEARAEISASKLLSQAEGFARINEVTGS